MIRLTHHAIARYQQRALGGEERSLSYAEVRALGPQIEALLQRAEAALAVLQSKGPLTEGYIIHGALTFPMVDGNIVTTRVGELGHKRRVREKCRRRIAWDRTDADWRDLDERRVRS